MCTHDRKEQKELRAQLHRLLKQEELKWLQRYKDREIKDGDCNTKYYHDNANGRRRKKFLSLHQDEGVIEREEYLIKYITNFYKNLFGQPDSSTINLNIQNAPGFTREQAALLIKHFSMEELHFCGV